MVDDEIDVAVGDKAAVALGEPLGLQDRPAGAIGIAVACGHGGNRRRLRGAGGCNILLIFRCESAVGASSTGSVFFRAPIAS